MKSVKPRKHFRQRVMEMNKLLISKRASLSRNFSDLPFPHKMDKEQRETGLARVSLAFIAAGKCLNSYIRATA